MRPRNIDAQVDFSGGQIDAIGLRRDDTKIARTSLRKARNNLPAPTGPTDTRMGRVLKSVHDVRVDDIKMSTGSRYLLCFRAARLVIRDRGSGAEQKVFTGLPWTDAECTKLRWDLFGDKIIICLSGMKPQVIDCDGAPPSWTIAEFAFGVGLRGQILQPYSRLADPGVTIQPAGYVGSGITITASAGVFVAGYAGTRIRYYGREIEITGFTSDTVLTGNVIEELPKTYLLNAGGGQSFTAFNAGDIVQLKTNGAQGYVSNVLSATEMHIIVESGNLNLSAPDEVIGPKARALITATAPLQPTPDPITIWDEPVMSGLRGWPASVTSDLARVAFCQIPSYPDGIAWSTINVYNDFGVTGAPDAALFERIRGQPRIVDIAPGPDIFVLTESGVFYIPVSADSPLVSGSVEFRPIDEVGVSATVRASTTGSSVLFVDSGAIGVWAIVQTGQTTRPYIVRELTPRCRSLVNSPVALAYQTGEAGNPDQLALAVMGDGTMIVGRFDPVEENVGWFQWDGGAAVTWASSRTTGALVNSTKTIVGNTFRYTEEFTNTALTDVEVDPVTPGAALDADKPFGMGPLWMFRGGTVRLRMGARDWGDRSVDALGNLLTVEGDDVTGSGWRVGLFFATEVGPFVWHADPGVSRKQRHRRRRVNRSAWTLQRNCAFEVEDGVGRVQQRPAHQQRDDNTLEAPTRLEEHRFRHTMSAFDPDLTIRQTTVGKMTLIEFSPEATI
jgi:hypothetical protein